MRLFGLFKGKKKEAAPSEAADPEAETSAMQAEPAPENEPEPVGRGLHKTRSRMSNGLRALFGGRALDDELYEQIEEELLLADVGVDATQAIMDTLQQEARRARSSTEVRSVLRRNLVAMLQPAEPPPREPPADGPWVMLVVGVNGSGKTTTIGKLAQRLQRGGHSVALAAGDTFRAAAVEQLQQWGQRVGAPVIAQPPGADSAAVIHDALAHAHARGIDVVLADTAGRLHTQTNLMDELRKVRRVIGRFDASAPHETLLVVDGGSGQNALVQAREFAAAVDVSGLALTKLDGTAKGGVAFAITRETGLPIRFIGVGERCEDLRPFDAEAFVDGLLGIESHSGA